MVEETEKEPFNFNKTGAEWASYFHMELGYRVAESEEDMEALKKAMDAALSIFLDELISENKICSECGTIPYGDGTCHCGQNKWKYVDLQELQKISKRLRGSKNGESGKGT